MPSKLSDAHQYFLQIMMNKSVIDERELGKIFGAVLNKFNKTYEQSSLIPTCVSYIMDINQHIKQFNIEIKKGVCEISGITYYCIIRQSDSASISNLSLLYSTLELNVFKKIISLIIASYDGQIDLNSMTIQIIDEYDQIASIASTQAQKTKVPSNKELRLMIEKFIQDHWLTRVINKSNMITLHGRAILELSEYIKEVFDPESLNFCFICKSLALCCVTCSHCDIKMHYHCAKNLFKGQKDCRSCKKAFDDDQINEIREEISKAKNIYLSQPA